MELSQEFREKRGQLFVDLVEQDIQDGWARYLQVQEHRELYYGTATANMPLPWKDASNIHLPIMQEKVETLVPMVMAAFWGVDPVVNVERSPDEYEPEQTDDVEMFQNFVVTKDIPNLHETTECWIRNMGLDGMSVLKLYWDRRFRDVSQIHTLKLLYDANEMTAANEPAPEARVKAPMELLIEIFGPYDAPSGLIDAQPLADYSEYEDPVGTEWNITFLEDRVLYAGYVRFSAGLRVDEIRAQVRRRILERDGAVAEVLEYEDIIVPYRTVDLQTADRVTQRYWVTVEEAREKVQSGEWNLTEEDLKILTARATKEYIGDSTDVQLQVQKDAVVGEVTGLKTERTSHETKFPHYDKNKIHVYLVHTTDTIETDGPRVEVIYHIPVALHTIARAEYLDEVYPHGRRPFICAKYLPISDRWAALGIGDQLAAINLEANTIINYINNNQELINNPFFFYENTAFTSDKEGIAGVRPGQGIPVMSVQGILFPNFPQQPLANMQELTTLLMFGDRVTLSPLNAGSSQMKNAPQTARGTLALLGEGHIKTDMLITRLQRGPWTELMEQIFGLYQEFMPDEKWYYITRDGQRRPNRITRSMLRGRYEFTFKGNTVNTNREVMRSMAQVRYNMVMTHPDYATDPNARREALRDLLKWWGDGVDISRLLPAMPGYGAYTHPPMQQQQENKILEQCIPVQVLPTDQHAEHLSVMDMFERSQQFALMRAEAVGLWASHKQQHMEQLRAQMAQQSTPVGAGMANNMPQGMSLAGGGNEMGQLEGGVTS